MTAGQFVACLRLATLVACAGAACSRSEPEPTKADTTDDAGPTVDAAIAVAPRPQHRPKSPPPRDDAAPPPMGKRDPGWDLDQADAARDYVRRYVMASLRYGDATSCVDPQASLSNDGKITVRVTDASPATCPAPSGVDETFAVVPDVESATDRLDLPTPQAGRPTLHKWPDESDPGGPPRASIPEIPEATKWTSPIVKVLKAHAMQPIRVQMYARGTYPVVTLPGFPSSIVRDRADPSLDALAHEVCAASRGVPVALFGGLDRSKILRLRCPGSSAWETL